MTGLFPMYLIDLNLYPLVILSQFQNQLRVVSLRVQLLVPSNSFYININDFSNCSTVFDFHLFADDSNLFLTDSSLDSLETRVNQELKHVHD